MAKRRGFAQLLRAHSDSCLKRAPLTSTANPILTGKPRKCPLAAAPSGRLAHHRLRAMAAAARFNRNFAQAFRTLFGGWICRQSRLTSARNQSIDGSHDKEINRSGNEQKADRRSDEIANRKHGASDRKGDPRKVRFADDKRDDGIDEVFDEGGYDRPKCRADYDAYSKVDYVAA